MKKRWLSAALAVVMAVSVAASQICVYAQEATPGNEQAKVQTEESSASAERSAELTAVSSDGKDVYGGSGASSVRKVTVTYGKPTVLAVTASGGVGELSYQWCRKEGSLWASGDSEEIEGATSNRYELVGAKGVSGVYVCRVEDDVCTRVVEFDVSVSTGLKAVSSDGKHFTGDGTSTKPSSSSSRAIVEAVAGEPLSLTVTASSLLGNVSYHWYSKEDEDYDDEAEMNSMEGLTDLGVTENKITLTENFDGDKYYRCLVTDGVMSKWVYFLTAWYTVREISSCNINFSQSHYYTGKAITPRVKANGPNRKMMYEGRHYTLSYKNNINIGTGTVVITGAGIYRGTVTKYFSIKADETKAYTVGSYKYKVTDDSTAAIVGLKNKNEQRLTVPATVKIGGKTFKVTSIADSAFSGCTKLTKAVVGTNVTKIGKNAFKNCKKLGTIEIKCTKLKSAGSNAFKGIKATAKIKVPAKQLKSYKNLLKGKGQGKKVQIVK